jgi:hypothetical protein
MPYGNGLLSSLHLDRYPMLNVSLWKLLSCNDPQNNQDKQQTIVGLFKASPSMVTYFKT